MADHSASQSKYPAMVSMYRSGKTFDEVGKAFGVSKARAYQIITAAGVRATEGGSAIRSFRSVADTAEGIRRKLNQREVTCRSRWGMSVADYSAIVAEYGNSKNPESPVCKYKKHQANAAQRGLGWNFTFASWWQVWKESGKWGERGRGGYVMGRYGDGDTPYGPDTVYICTQSENAVDSFIAMPASVRRAKANTNKAAKP